MRDDYTKGTIVEIQIPKKKITEFMQASSTCSPMTKYQLLESLKQIVRDLRKGMIAFYSNELVPKMLEVGKTRGTADFEESVKDLLATLAKKIPSAEYGQEFEKYI